MRPRTNQILDDFAGIKIELKTPEEATKLIENMAASDHVIIQNRTHGWVTKWKVLWYPQQGKFGKGWYGFCRWLGLKEGDEVIFHKFHGVSTVFMLVKPIDMLSTME